MKTHTKQLYEVIPGIDILYLTIKQKCEKGKKRNK